MKQAIVVVSFGTTHADAEETCIRPVEAAIQAAFPGWEVRRAWTARMIRAKLKSQGVEVDGVTEAIDRLRGEGFDRIALASAHIIRGHEYDMLTEAADGLPVSAPLLDGPDDIAWMTGLLGGIADEEGRALVVMGHGTDHAANATYAELRQRLPGNVFLACVEGEYGLDGIMDQLEAVLGRRVTLMPLMLVAGDHAKNDLAGDEDDSWKRRLEARGFDVRVRLQGLGALPEVQQRFVEKVGTAIGRED